MKHMKGIYFRKSDIVLGISLLVVGFALSFILSFGTGSGESLEISVDGELYGTYSLSQDKEILISGQEGNDSNTVAIEDGCVYMKESTCGGQDCVRSGRISQAGETIVCLPHRVMLEIKGGEPVYDSVSR